MSEYMARIFCKKAMLFLLLTGTGIAGHIPVSDARQVAEAIDADTSTGYQEIRDRRKSRPAAVLSSTEAGQDNSGLKKPSYRRTRSTDAAAAFTPPRSLAPGRCGIVDHIEFVRQLYHGDSGSAGTFISGMAAIPYGQHGEKLFYADVAVAGSSGYFPPHKNIVEPIYFKISLLADDGNYYVITQRIPPQFQTGESVKLGHSGLLEKADCVMQNPEAMQR